MWFCTIWHLMWFCTIWHLIWFCTIWHLMWFCTIWHFINKPVKTWPRPWCRKMAIVADSLVGSSLNLVCIHFIYPSIWCNFCLDFKCLQFLSKMFKVDWVIIGDFAYSIDCNVNVTYYYPNQFSLGWIVLWNVLSLVRVLSCEFPETPSKIQQLVTAPESVMKCSRFYCYFNLERIIKMSCRAVQFIQCPDVTSTSFQMRMLFKQNIILLICKFACLLFVSKINVV